MFCLPKKGKNAVRKGGGREKGRTIKKEKKMKKIAHNPPLSY